MPFLVWPAVALVASAFAVKSVKNDIEETGPNIALIAIAAGAAYFAFQAARK